MVKVEVSLLRIVDQKDHHPLNFFKIEGLMMEIGPNGICRDPNVVEARF